METTIQKISNSMYVCGTDELGSVRTIVKDGEPLFCLADVCKVLELSNPSAIKARLTADTVQVIDLHDLNSNEVINGNSQANFVNEDGLYDVILDSRKPEARKFRKWITSEVLPSIRKTGGYIAANDTMTDADIMARALLVAQKTIEKREQRINELQEENQELAIEAELNAPKVEFADAVQRSETSILVGELAKLMAMNGVEIGQRRLFEWLRENGYTCKRNGFANFPTQRSIENNWLELTERHIIKPNGTVLLTFTTKVTGKGQVYFINKMLKNSK